MENPLVTQSTDTKEKPRLAEAFTALTGVETTENDEVRAFRTAVVEEADKFLKSFMEKGLISKERGLITEETKREALDIWKNLIVLDTGQLNAYERFHTGIYRQAVEDLSQTDPEGTNEEVQALIREAKTIIQINDRSFSKGFAFTCRANPVHAGKAKEVGMPERWIIVNWGRKDEILDRPYLTRAIVYEETAHLISRLSDYGNDVPGKWVDEMMARVVAFGMPSGHNKEDPDYIKAREGMLLEEYKNLFYLIAESAGDKQTLFRMFFGVEPPDSMAAKKIGKALDRFSFIGEIVDAGISRKAVIKYLNDSNTAESVKNS